MNFASFKEDMGKDELWEDFLIEDNIPYTFNVRLLTRVREKNSRAMLRPCLMSTVLMESEVMASRQSHTLDQRIGFIVLWYFLLCPH